MSEVFPVKVGAGVFRILIAFLGVVVFLSGCCRQIVAGKLAELQLEPGKHDEKQIYLCTPENQLLFRNGSCTLEFNGVPVIMPDAAVRSEKGVWTLPERSVNDILLPLLKPVHRRVKTVLLDPGHGGSDPGAKGVSGSLEKNLNLMLTLEIGKFLRQHGFKVFYTRETDRTVALGKRGGMSVGCKADLFVSVHHNASRFNPLASGMETFVLTRKNSSREWEKHARSVRLAYLIQKEQSGLNRSFGRGVKFANFRVLRDAPVCGVLVEAGFVTCKSDEAKALNPEYRQNLAAAIARAIVQFSSL